LVRYSALLLLLSSCALGSIRPSFYLDACSWNATEIVVLAPSAQAGTFRVIEVIKGELGQGESLELPSLTPPREGTARLDELSSRDFNHPFEVVPPIGQSDRLIVFLRRPGALPEYNPRPDLPVDTSGWEPANFMMGGDLRTSAVWIQDGVTYVFAQTMNPGSTRLTALLMSETQLRKSVQSVLQLRGAMDRALANPDPAERSGQFGALVRSGNLFARNSALQKLERGGVSDVKVLVDLLSDQSLLGWHQDIIDALVRKRVADVHFGEFLGEETTYWSRSCRTLKPGWWNGAQYPAVEMARNRYTRAYALLEAIRELNLSEAIPVVREFAAVWSRCPPLDRREKTDQIAEALKLLVGD
jgi:hypothetical protein